MKKVILTLLILASLSAIGYFFILPDFGKDKLIIVMSTEATDISPYGLNLNNATRIGNIFEGLVAFDRNLKIVPSLAISWGNLDDTTWEFRIRSGVHFHDGSIFTPQDVVNSFETAKASGNAQISQYIKTIKKIKITAPDRIEVTTYSPDPLLLSKLTKIFIHKNEKIGTGPYILSEWTQGNHFILNSFEEYWGGKPYFSEVIYKVLLNRYEREVGFKQNKIDILVGITEDQALELPKEQMKKSYGLEVNFLMFKLDDEIFKNKKIRDDIHTLFDPDKIEAIGNHFIRHSDQFIAPGVFGYNQNIKSYQYSIDTEAHKLFGNRLQPVTLDYLSSYRTLSEYISDQLRKAGFSVNAITQDPNTLLEKIKSDESQMYLIGWRSADGDAGGFYDSFIHSEGVFNNGNYVNNEVDTLIEKSRIEMDPQKRLALLQEIGKKVTEDTIGIPLFETSRLFAVQEGVNWHPRLDGLVLGAEVSQ